jgi:hypothetical protein
MAFTCEWKDENGKACGVSTNLSFTRVMFPKLDRDFIYYCPAHEESFKAKYGFRPLGKG